MGRLREGGGEGGADAKGEGGKLVVQCGAVWCGCGFVMGVCGIRVGRGMGIGFEDWGIEG